MDSIDYTINSLVDRYRASGIEQLAGFDKDYLYSLITHSTAIEGSTITEVENQLLFDEDISPYGRPMHELLMNIDARDAYVRWRKYFKEIGYVDVDTLCSMAASIMRRTGGIHNTPLGSFDSSKGDLRLVNVGAGASGRSYMAFQKVPSKIKEFCLWLNQRLSEIGEANPAEAYRFSFAAHFRLATIHPWIDGNGRASRLLMNVIQDRYGLPMSKIAKQDKAAYIQALVDARENDNEEIFVLWAMRQLAASLEREIDNYEKDTAL